MVFKKGNTYELKVEIENINIEEISKIVFKFNDIKKTYPVSGQTEDVVYQEDGTFIIYLTQQETLSLADKVEYEVGVKFTDDTVKKSEVYSTSSIKTIIQEVL